MIGGIVYSALALLAVIPLARWLYRDAHGDAPMFPHLTPRGAVAGAIVLCYAWPLFLAAWVIWQLTRPLAKFVGAGGTDGR